MAPLDPAFVADSLYDETALLYDEVIEVDRDRSLVRLSMPTRADLPLTRAQRVHPTRHPRHVSGGLLVHVSAMVGFAHAYYVLDLRAADGWVGYGAVIHRVRYPHLAEIGEPVVLEGRATRVKRGARRIVARYTFQFDQAGKTVYEGDQTAVWMHTGS